MPDLMSGLEAFQNRTKDDAPLVCLTAYSAPMAQSLAPHVDLLLVGDSLGMVLYGMDSTQGVSIEMMIAHGCAVLRGRAGHKVPVIIDMPYGSYEASDALALENARRLMHETGANGVKLEGGVCMAGRIQAFTGANIPVMAHIGLLPQSAPDEGGYKIKGKTPEGLAQLLEDGRAVQKAGAFAVVIEGTIENSAREVTKALDIPTIGIGASPACSGQILVAEDMLGLLHSRKPKFAKEYACLRDDIEVAAKRFADDVRGQVFPSNAHLYKGEKS